VAVEKLDISEIRGNFGDRKRLAKQRKSFVEQPDAIFFCGFLANDFFNSHACFRQLLSRSSTGNGAGRI
jgi:hypothetical protein